MSRIDTLIETLEILDATGYITGKPFRFDMGDCEGLDDSRCGCLAVICKGLRNGIFSSASSQDIEIYLEATYDDSKEIYFGAGEDSFDMGDIRLREAITMLANYRETGIVDWSHVEDRWAREDQAARLNEDKP
jgi:hypothetical protein